MLLVCAEKFEKEAAEMNKRSFKYAWVSSPPTVKSHAKSRASCDEKLPT